MGLLDFFTGGKSDEATEAMRKAEEAFGNVNVPTVQQLTLPELQKYVEAGIMTPAEASAYLQTQNAYANEAIPQTGTASEIQALNQLSQVANAGAQGTPMEQAQMANALSQMNQAIGGQEGAIEQGMEARGVPASLVQAALKEQAVGQQGQNAYLAAVNAQGQMYQNALNALSQQGALGGSLQGQQNTQANTVAAAQNAMQQFNAQNQQQAAQFNAANQQAANAYNAQNRQNVANQNTGLENTRTTYNAQLPETVFGNQMQKASGQAGAFQNAANLAQQQGQQNAGIWGGLINLGTSFIPKPGGAGAAPAGGGGGNAFAMGGVPVNTYQPNYSQMGYAHGGIINDDGRMSHDHSICMAHGGYCMEGGGFVPGAASVGGDSLSNDRVPIHASPGEAVIPRSSVAENPDLVGALLGDQNPGPGVDFQDVATLLKALRSIRMGVA